MQPYLGSRRQGRDNMGDFIEFMKNNEWFHFGVRPPASPSPSLPKISWRKWRRFGGLAVWTLGTAAGCVTGTKMFVLEPVQLVRGPCDGRRKLLHKVKVEENGWVVFSSIFNRNQAKLSVGLDVWCTVCWDPNFCCCWSLVLFWALFAARSGFLIAACVCRLK